jgi:hypothetical protein
MAAKQPEKSNQQAAQDGNADAELLQMMLRLKEQGKIKEIPGHLLADKPAVAESPAPEAEIVTPPIETATEAVAPAQEERNPMWKPVMKGLEAIPAPPEVNPADVLPQLPERDGKMMVVSRKQILPAEENAAPVEQTVHTPWTLQQFFDGEIDLEVELSKRFSTMPMMAIAKFRTLGSHAGRRVATLEAADGSATLIIDADVPTKVVQLSFTYGSMLTLRFSLDTLTGADRTRWLELMNREQGGLAFLWGPGRWQSDYLICIARRYTTNIYAFSPNNFEAAVRLTPAVITELLQWLDEIWNAPDEEADSDAPLLTW